MPFMQGNTQTVSVQEVYWQTFNAAFWSVKQLRASFYCLQLSSKTHTCSGNACRTCNQRHHTLLHTAMQTQSADRQGSMNIYNVSSIAKQNVTPVTNNSTNEAQTHRSFKNKFNQYVPCRVLLESAAQVNFTTQRCEEGGCTKPHNDGKKFHTTVWRKWMH